MTKNEKHNLEQCMAYLFRKIYKSPEMRIGKKREDYLWSSMCAWVDEYIELVKRSENIELRQD